MGLGLARVIGKVIPTVARTAVEELTPLARRLGSFGGTAATIADDVVRARNLGQQVAGTMLRETDELVTKMSGPEAASLAGAIRGEAEPIGNAATLLAQGQRLAARTGRPFGTEIRARLADLSPRAAADGRALYQRAVQDEADALTKRIVTERLGPMVDQLPDGPQRALGRQLVNAVEHGTGGTGQLAGLRAFNTATLLGRAVLLNTTQPLLSAAVAGLGPARRAVGQMLTSGGRQEVRDLSMRLGTAIDTGLTNFLSQEAGTGMLGQASSAVLRRTGFNAVERLNRHVATAIGSQWFDDLARQAGTSPQAARHLARHGVSRVRDLTSRDRAQFIQNFVRRTQFRMTPEELPGFMSARGFPAEMLRTAFQFKPFALKATELMLDEMREQPASFLARAIGLGATAGLPASELRRLTSGSTDAQQASIPRRLFDAVMALGTAGMFYDAVMAAQGGERRVLEFFAGPSASTAAEFGAGAARAVEGEPRTLLRAGLRRVPVVGPLAAGMILPRPERRSTRGGPILPQ